MIRAFVEDIDNEGSWVEVKEELLDLSEHDAEVRADAIEKIKGRLLHRDYDFHKDGDYFTIEEVFEQLKEQK